MPRIEIGRSIMIVTLTLALFTLPHQAQGRGGLGGFHGAGFHVARVGGIRPGLGAGHFGGVPESGVTGLRLPSGAFPSRMHVMEPHPMSLGAFHGYRPTYGLSRYHAGGYGGIHTGGYLTGERYARVHYRPSMGYYHPGLGAAYGIRDAAARAASLNNAYNYWSTYYNLGGISPSYLADPYYNPYQGLYSDPVP